MEIKFLIQNLTLTGLTKFLNKEKQFKKKSGGDFTTNDVWQYIRLGHLPHYMGGNKIELSNINSDIKLYNILKE